MRGLLVLVLFLVALGVGVWNRIQAIRDRVSGPTGHVVAAIDTTMSFDRDCGQIVDRVVTPAIEAVPLSNNSTFSLLVTGGASSSYEPRLVLADKAIPHPAQTGFMRIQRKGQTLAQFTNEIKQTCKAQPIANLSSLYRTLEVGLEHLRPHCPERGQCVFVFDTDMRENINRDVAAFLGGTKRTMTSPRLKLGTIRVVLCGYAVSTDGAPPVQNGEAFLDRVRALFDGEIDLRPYCEGAITLPTGV